MTTFIHEPDGEGEPTIFAIVSTGTSADWRYDVLLRRVDLHPDVRTYWDELVERITGEKP